MQAALHEFDEILRTRAPLTHGTLRPAAQTELLHAFAPTTALPSEVTTLWNWHNGSEPSPAALQLVPQFDFIGTNAATSFWNQWHDLKQEFPHGPWQPDWIAIATDGCGGILVVDRNDYVFAATPEAGEFVRDIAKSLTELIHELLNAVKNNESFHGHQATYVDGVLLWQPTTARPPGAYDYRYTR